MKRIDANPAPASPDIPRKVPFDSEDSDYLRACVYQASTAVITVSGVCEPERFSIHRFVRKLRDRRDPVHQGGSFPTVCR